MPVQPFPALVYSTTEGRTLLFNAAGDVVDRFAGKKPGRVALGRLRSLQACADSDKADSSKISAVLLPHEEDHEEEQKKKEKKEEKKEGLPFSSPLADSADDDNTGDDNTGDDNTDDDHDDDDHDDDDHDDVDHKGIDQEGVDPLFAALDDEISAAREREQEEKGEKTQKRRTGRTGRTG